MAVSAVWGVVAEVGGYWQKVGIAASHMYMPS